MGNDIERFLGYVNDGLLCCICRDVLERPLQAPCEHAFCASCIPVYNNCPEDRQTLAVTDLKALHRYMRNELSRLQIQCKNDRSGCEMVCSLGSIDKHEKECEYGCMSCINAGCPVQFERRHLDSHLVVCEHRSRECPNGCGYGILSAEDLQHNCIALRTELELLSITRHVKYYTVPNEMRLLMESMDSQVYPGQEIRFGNQEQSPNRLLFTQNCERQVSQLMSDVRTLMASERQIRQDLEPTNLEPTNLEKRELMVLLKGLQPECRTNKDEVQKTSSDRSTLPESFKEKNQRGL